MTRKQIVTGIAVTASLAVVAFFFILVNPLAISSMSQSDSTNTSAGAPSNSGLVVQDESVGTGAVASAGDVITVNYTGKLQNGTVFDSSVGRTPFQFTLGIGQVIAGWDQGLQGMKVGGKRLLIIPSALAYGPNDYGPIPGNSTLIFEVTLVGVQAATTTDTGPSLEGSAAN